MNCKRYIAAILVAAVILIVPLSSAAAYEDSEIIGEVPILLKADEELGGKNIRNQQCSLGSAAADAARLAAGTDFAILNGGDFEGNLPPGEADWQRIQGVFSNDRELAEVSVTATELWQILEHGVSKAVLNEELKIDRKASEFDGFPQVSGFKFCYDMSAPVGERIYSVTADNGEKIDRGDTEHIFTLCASAFLLDGGYGYPVSAGSVTELGITQAEALAAAIASGSIKEATVKNSEKRIKVIGSGDYNLLETSPGIVIIIALVLIAVNYSIRVWRKSKFRRS